MKRVKELGVFIFNASLWLYNMKGMVGKFNQYTIASIPIDNLNLDNKLCIAPTRRPLQLLHMCVWGWRMRRDASRSFVGSLLGSFSCRFSQLSPCFSFFFSGLAEVSNFHLRASRAEANLVGRQEMTVIAICLSVQFPRQPPLL